ncbi:hypothetical protein C8J56DRAFT_1039881 [Mycena floridula]|nr:hypothetical protein C8J56DRAFT_1039881 [Mycena floridula]
MRRYLMEKKKVIPELLHRKEMVKYCLAYEDRTDRIEYWDSLYAKDNHRREPRTPVHARNNADGLNVEMLTGIMSVEIRGPEEIIVVPLEEISLGTPTDVKAIKGQADMIIDALILIEEMREVICYSCKAPGHYASDRNCPNYGKRNQAHFRAMNDDPDAGPSNGPDTLEGAATRETNKDGERRSEHHSVRSARSSRHSSVSSGYRSGSSSEYGSARNLSYYEDLDDRHLSGSRSSVSHRAMRVLDDYDEFELYADKAEPIVTNWGRPIPFYLTDVEYEIGFSLMQGEMRVGLLTTYELVMDEEVIVRIVEPGFDQDDQIGPVQLFYGYEQQLLRDMFGHFVFNMCDIPDCSSASSLQQDWNLASLRKRHIDIALRTDTRDSVLEYGQLGPYKDSTETESSSEHSVDWDSCKDDAQELYFGLHVEDEEFREEMERLASMSLNPIRHCKFHVSGKKLVRPSRSGEQKKCLTAWFEINGLKAYTLCDTGSTTDAISPDFAHTAKIKAHPLENPVNVALGTIGSRSKINFGTYTDVKYGTIDSKEYWDILNID